MRNFKRLISMCLAVLMAVSAMPYVVFSAGEETVSLEEDGYAVYEAEAAYRSGYAVVEENSNASGGAVVTNIGGPNTDVGAIVFEDVYAAANAVYQVELYYIAQNAGDFYVMLNEGSSVTINNESSGSNINVYTMNLRLRSGYNTIKIYSTTETVVKVDCIRVNTEKEITSGVYEDDAASLGGSAQRRRVYGAEDGWAISGIDQNSSAEFTVNIDAGKYDLFIWYSAYDYRNLDVYVDGEFYTDIFCPITGEDYNIETVRVGLDLSAGEHKITFRGKNSYAPDIDKIQLVLGSEQTDNPPSGSTETGLLEMGNGEIEVKYDLSSGTADFYSGGTLRVSGIESAVKVEAVGEYRNESIDTVIKSSDYGVRTYETEALNDGFGTGTLYKISSTGCAYGDMPDMCQNIRIYDGLPYAIIDVELLSETSISTNFMAPISAAGEDIVNIGAVDDGRTLFVPYDNDNWVRYKANSINGNNTSYWATAIYDNNSRNAIVFGSLDHDTFKTGANVSGADNKINFLGGFGGIWSAQYTYDYLPHGSIDGTQVGSPKFMLGYFDDWRDGMEAYGEANEINNSKLNWNGGTPFGYNSWYAQGTNLNFTESARASDFIAGLDDFKSDDGVAYINLDSYWDFMSDDELRAFVQKCHSNGQKAGIYWSHFVGWSKDMSYGSGVGNRPMRDAALEDKYGNVVSMAKTNDSYPLDPTSEVMEERMRSLMTKFVDMGFEFLKVDFLNYAAIEGEHADPEIKTGMQAYNKALSDLTSYVDTDNFFISLSIAPLFPSAFAHSRRISCDVGEGINAVEYMLNSLTYGWWEDDTLYSYTDPDHIVLSDDLTYSRTRYTAAAISGTLMLLSNLYSDETMRGVTEEVTSNKAVNDLARKGKAFRPVEGNTGDEAGDVFILDEGKSVYVAMFNTDYYNIFGAIVPIKKTVMLDLERIGLSGGQTYEVTDLWTGETSNVSGTISKVLEGSGSALLRIDTPDRPSIDDLENDALYYEDFESDTIEDEVKQKQNGWSWDGSDEDAVAATEAGMWVGDNGSGSKSLRFTTGDSWYKENWLTLDADTALEAYGADVSKLGEDISVSFNAKFEIQDAGGGTPEQYVRIKGRDRQSIAEISVKDGKLYLIALNADGTENVSYEIKDVNTGAGTTDWHSFRFRFDMSENKFELIVDGEVFAAASADGWIPVSNKAGIGEITEPIREIGVIDSIEFGNLGGGWYQSIYLDDLKITPYSQTDPESPEPTEPPSETDTIYYEDFESDTAEAEVKQKENGWSWDGSDEDTVAATEAGIWVGDNGSGSNGLRFATGDTWFKSNWLVLDADEAVEAYGSDVSKLGEDLSISFKAKFEIQGLDTNTEPPEHYIRIKGKDQQSVAEVSVKDGKLNLIALNPDGTENAAYEIKDVNTGSGNNDWHSFEFRFNMSENKFALLVDGELVTAASDDGWIPVSNKAGVGEITEPIQEIGVIDSIEFGNYYAGWWQCMYLDDLKIDSADYSENITDWSIDNIEIDPEIVLGEENEFTLTYTHPSDPQEAKLMVAVYRGESLYDLYTVDLTPSETEGSEEVTFRIGIPEDISEARAYIWTPELEPLCDSFDINVY